MLFEHAQIPQNMGDLRGGGTCPLEFGNMTSYAAVLQNTIKFSLTPSALAIRTLHFSLKRCKNRKNFRLCLESLSAPKNGRFFVRCAESVYGAEANDREEITLHTDSTASVLIAMILHTGTCLLIVSSDLLS